MKRGIVLLILIVGASCVTPYDQHETTEQDQLNIQNVRVPRPNNLTVETESEIERSETMTEARGQELVQGRTFAVKRLQMMLLPLMYKMGVMTTLLVLLVAVSLKTLFVGILLLGLKIGTFISKFHQPQSHQPLWSPPVQSWQPPQPVHIHWHQDDHAGPYSHHSPYDRQDQQVQDVVYSALDQFPSSTTYQKPVAINGLGQYVYRG